MKKLLSLILVLMMLVSFAACAGETNETETTENSASATAPITAEENLLTVTVTLAAAIFEDQTEEEIITKAKENGIKKCVVNEDGSVTYTMSKAKHKETLDDLKKSIEESSNELINGANKVESFIEIKSNEDFSEFNVYVDPDKYTAWDSMNAMAFFLQGMYYQCLLGVDYNKVDVVVNFVNNETQEIMDTTSYKKFAESMEG